MDSGSQGKPERAAGGRSSLFVGSVEKAFQVLESFHAPGQQQMSIAEIARAADLDRSATQRLVHTLEQLRYIYRVPNSSTYRLASRSLGLAYNYLRAHELIQRASPYLLDISRTLGETCNLHELDGHEIVYLARFPGQHLINIDFAVGYRLPAVYTASGIAILSRLDDAARRAIIAATPLKPMTPVTETDPERLLAVVAAAADQGYAVVHNQTVMGDISVSAPITGHLDTPLGAISVAVPTTRWTVDTAREKLVPHVQVAAMSISHAMRGSYQRP